MIYNRVRDFGLYIAILMILVYRGSQNFQFRVFNTVVSVRLLVRIVAKSAQFLFHPWLPNAIESLDSVLIEPACGVVDGRIYSILDFH